MRAVISMSGGLDSTCLALDLLAQGYEVRAYAFDYGQKHDVELKKLKKNIKIFQAKGFKIDLQVINLRDVFSDSVSSLNKNTNQDIPKADYDQENMKSTVVENRNVIFSSIIYGKALSWSKVDGDVVIALGIHAGDHTLYPDTTKESQEAAKHLFKISNWGSEKVDYIAPFVDNSKTEVLGAGLTAMKTLGLKKSEMNKILKNTHSCYDPNEKGESCGCCGTCKERIDAFKANGLKDPVKYFN
ncbi:MAG: 7-cyano-7-deazaguanine synthase [Parabacteroides sp.]|nr:7-cyano-7-deazaguanine synthase [Parabacteroides sp.]